MSLRERSADVSPDRLTLLQAANRILSSALTSKSEEELGEACLAVAREVTDSAFGCVGDIGPDGKLYDIAVTAPCREAPEISAQEARARSVSRFPMAGLCGHVLKTGESVCTNAPEEHPHGGGVRAERAPVTSFLGVALRRSGKVVGVVAVANRPGGYRDEDVAMLEALAPSISAAIHGKRASVLLERYHAIFRSMDEGFCLIEVLFDDEGNASDFRYLEVNAAFEGQTGLTDVIGRKVSELLPEAEDYWLDLYGRVAMTGVPERLQERSAPLGRYFDVHAFRVGDPTDRHVAVVFKDVSEQRKTEAALRDSETRANDLLRYAPTGIYQIAFDPPRFLEVNDAMCMMSGYSRQELLSMDPLDLLDDESKALFMERMRRSLAGDAPVGEVEYRVRRKDGRRIFVVLNVRFTHDSDGRPEGAFVVGHDVTERRRDEEALRRSEQRFALLSHANSLLLSASEPESLIQTIAAGVMDLLGCDVFFNYVRDAETGRLHLNAHGGVDAEMAKAVEWLDPGTAICGCVLQESSPIVSEDVQHNGDPRAALVRSMGVQAYACHPLLVGEETVGTLSFGSKSRISFGEDDLAVMRTVASGVSVALERKRAEDALRESDSRFRGVLETALDAAYRRDLVKDAYDYMSPVVESITGFTADEFSHLPMQEVLERIHPEDRSAVEDAIAVSERTGRLISEYRFRAKNGHYVWLADYSTVVDDRANGVSYRTGTVRDITERKLAEEALRESFLLARVLNQTNEMLLSSSDPADVFPEVLREASAVLEADYAVVSLKADADWRIAYGFESPLTPGSIVPAARAKGAEAIARSGQIFVSEDALSDERLDADYIGELGVRAFMHVPLSVRHRIIGILSFHNTHAPRRYTDSQKWFAGHLGSSVSLALENARAFQAEVEGKRLAQALSRIEQSIHSTLDRDEMLQRVADESSEVIGADGTTLALREDDSWVIRYGYGASARLIGMAFGPEEAPFITTAMDTGRPVAIDDAWSDPRARADRNRELGIRAVMMTPLIVRDEVLGGLFFNYRDAHHFTHQEVQYASRLGISLGLAVANVGLYEAQREVADLLQAALLSLPAELPGVEFSHAYHSATETARVGGDFYDVFELSHDHLGLVVGDVAGKGLDAAVLTSLVKNTVRAHASERGKTPAQVLSLTNDVVYKGTPTEAFVTVFFGMLDLRDGRLVYANAGHTTAALASKHAVVKLPVTGPILGAFPDLQYEQAEASIDLGELLFLYTDGLTEARNGTHLFGEERLFDLIAEHCEKCTRDLVDHVIGEVVTYAGNRLRDDLAMLALRRVDDGLRTPTQQKLEL